jgi:excinuclease ABC subunit B
MSDAMRQALEESNRRRYIQTRFNLDNQKIPQQAQRSGAGQSTLLPTSEENKNPIINLYDKTEEQNNSGRMAADVNALYITRQDIDAEIEQAKKNMERAAKSLDFLAAARFRDHMYELQKIKDKIL